MPEPLEGIRVVEVARALQGPVAGQYLADMGADVIKVEPALSDPNRRFRIVGAEDPESGFGTQFVSANRGKRSLWLDLRDEASLEVVRQLVDRADVFLSNYLEPSLIAMGLGYEPLRARNEELVYALVNGYGPVGPDAAKRMLDGAAAARGGLYSVTGPRDGAPMMPGSTIADLAGAMQLALGITTALAARELHGGSQRVDTSALGAQLFLQAFEIDSVSLSGDLLTRAGAHHANIHGTYGLYETTDGAVMIAFLSDEPTWIAFCEFAGLEENARPAARRLAVHGAALGRGRQRGGAGGVPRRAPRLHWLPQPRHRRRGARSLDRICRERQRALTRPPLRARASDGRRPPHPRLGSDEGLPWELPVRINPPNDERALRSGTSRRRKEPASCPHPSRGSPSSTSRVIRTVRMRP